MKPFVKMNAATLPDIRVQNFEFDSATVQVVIQGVGAPIMLLHGAGTDTLANWQPLYDYRPQNHTLIGVQLPGAGDTRWREDRIEVADLIYRLAEVVEAVSPGEPVKIAGYSTGAMLAIGLAAHFGERATHLAAAAPWQRPDAQLRLFFRLWQRLLLDPEVFASFNALVAFSNETLGAIDDVTLASVIQANTPSPAAINELRKLIEMNLTADLSPLLSRVRARTTILSFDHDRVIPPRHARQVAEQIAGSELLTIAAGHAGPWEANELFIDRICAALDLAVVEGDSL